MVSSKNVLNWSVDYLQLNDFTFSQKYPFIKISDILERSRNTIIIQDDIFYKRVTVKLYGGGVKVRDEVKGDEIGTKKQFLLKEGQFLFSRIDARNGAFGLATAEVNNAIVTNDFPVYDVNKTINPRYFSLITTSKPFFDYCQNFSSGTTGRQRIDETSFLDFKIPLPSLAIQNQLVADYENKIAAAKEAEEKAKELERGIESYLLEALGVEIPNLPIKKNYLRMAKFSQIDRWDYDYVLNKNEGFFYALENAKYLPKKMGNIYDFTSRSWIKKEYPEKTFRYIEIGSIDPLLGITNYSEIAVEEAPSRATQIIKENDLILGLTRPYLKKFSLVSAEYNGYICSSGFQIIAPSENYNITFLLEFLKSEAGVKQFEFYMAGALYPAITSKQLQDLLIPLPPLNIQTEIVSHTSIQKTEIKRLKLEAEMLRASAKADFEQEVFI